MVVRFSIRRAVSMVATVDCDPEVKYLPDAQAVANFSTANPPGRLAYLDVSGAISSIDVNERVYEVTVHGKLAKICGKHLAKGQKILIRGGRLGTRRARVVGLSSLRPFISRVHHRKRQSVRASQTMTRS